VREQLKLYTVNYTRGILSSEKSYSRSRDKITEKDETKNMQVR